MISQADIEKFETWITAAEATEVNDPNAMSLATVDEKGMPNIRIVLLKSFGPEGFLFFTNHESSKGRELSFCRAASLCFMWKSQGRSVTVQGFVEIVGEAESDEYFRSRPRLSQMGARASQQSRPLSSRLALMFAVAKLTLRYGLGPVPRPKHWGGFRLSPSSIEFHEE